MRKLPSYLCHGLWEPRLIFPTFLEMRRNFQCGTNMGSAFEEYHSLTADANTRSVLTVHYPQKYWKGVTINPRRKGTLIQTLFSVKRHLIFVTSSIDLASVLSGGSSFCSSSFFMSSVLDAGVRSLKRWPTRHIKNKIMFTSTRDWAKYFIKS